MVNISKKKILYISPEYGYDENLNNYAGGLGILAGDFIKEASDNSYPILCVGLLYKNGYFNQTFDDKFNQISNQDINTVSYNSNNYLKENNEIKIFEIKTNIGNILFKVLITNIANINLYLIDSDIDSNGELAIITEMLYTPSRELRLLQEILLGQGAIKIMNYLNYDIDILHINEGHAAFALLERINIMVDNNIPFEKAFQKVKLSNYFTTHTPIIHGNEEFAIDLLKEILMNSSLLRYISFDDFINLGFYQNKFNFSMTAFAIRLSNRYNSVSKLHNKVATKMWKIIKEDISFDNVTNGIYIKDWLPQEFATFINNQPLKIDIVNAKQMLKKRILSELNYNSFYNKSLSLKELYKNTVIYDDDIIIGFARRFAPYKRANILFTDIQKLKLFFMEHQNTKILISGKAHPADIEGKAIIRDILTKILANNLQNNIIFIEDYNISKAKAILGISDIWLNNPIRGLEACGTSGMKACLNGAINLSILDGWWDEAYKPSIGFKIGNKRINNFQNDEIASLIFNEIQNIILIKNNADKWATMILNSFNYIKSKYNTTRMLEEYNQLYYKYNSEK